MPGAEAEKYGTPSQEIKLRTAPERVRIEWELPASPPLSTSRTRICRAVGPRTEPVGGVTRRVSGGLALRRAPLSWPGASRSPLRLGLVRTDAHEAGDMREGHYPQPVCCAC